jgi:hypothetical protein
MDDWASLAQTFLARAKNKCHICQSGFRDAELPQVSRENNSPE